MFQYGICFKCTYFLFLQIKTTQKTHLIAKYVSLKSF